MKIGWERLAGDRSVFALKIGFRSDPDRGKAIDPEVGHSWGSFQLWVGGRNLCLHHEEGERVDSVHWYLLPLLEWFARNWDPLFHEERLPVKNIEADGRRALHATRFPDEAVEANERKALRWESRWQAWRDRHALHAAREGGLFPDVVFRRYRDRIEVSWGPTPVAGMPSHYRFLEAEAGSMFVSPDLVAAPIHSVLLDASRHLRSFAPSSERIEALHRKLRNIENASASRERRLMWLAGMGATPSTARAGWQRVTDCLADLAEPARNALLEVRESPLVITGGCQAALMFGSAAPEVNEEDVRKLAQVMVDLYSPRGDSAAMRDLCRDVWIEQSDSPAWGQGYELAKEVHDRFDGKYREEAPVPIEDLLTELDVSVTSETLSDVGNRAVAIAGPQHRPGIAVNASHSANAHLYGRRFTLAHELCHLLFDREQGRALAIASGPWAPRAIESRANAFAAGLLMPGKLVRQTVARLRVPVTTVEGVREVSKRLRVGLPAVLNHLGNLGFLDESDQQRLEEEMAPADP